ncbi:MAG: aldo/keto reductase [Solirubrobacterales bacterium]
MVRRRPAPGPRHSRIEETRWRRIPRHRPARSRRLGDSELEVSVIGLGCNNFGRRLDRDGTVAVLEAALDARSITLFDTADIYGGAGENEG